MARYRSPASLLLLCGLPAAGQSCPSLQAIDLGAAGLSTGAFAFEPVHFAVANSARLVAVGDFTRAGLATVEGLAAWDGAAWSAIPGAPADCQLPMRLFDDGTGTALYIAGVGALHRFNGATWSDVPLPFYNGQPVGRLVALAPFDPDGPGPQPPLLAAAFPLSTGTIVVQGYNGTGWVPLGAFVLQGAYCGAGMKAYDADGAGPLPPKLYLFVDTQIEYGPGHFAWDCRLFRFDEPSWTGLLTVGGGNYPGLVCMDVYDADGPGPQLPRLIVGGDFYISGVPGAGGVAAFNGTSWSALGSGSNTVTDMAVYDADGSGPGNPVLVAHNTTYPDNHLMQWDGASWSPFPSAAPDLTYGPLAAFDENGTQALAVGAADTIGGIPVHNFAVWRRDHWAPPAPRPVGVIRAVELFDDGSGPRLFAAGAFPLIGTQIAHGVARWDGQAWSPLVSGLEGTAAIPGPTATAMAVHNDGSGSALYVAGSFGSVAGQSVGNIARWNGHAWSRVGLSGVNNTVWALAVHDPDGPGPLAPRLYAGGLFTEADGTPANHLAVWDGVAWSQPAGGTDGEVRALQSFDDGSGPVLYIGGFPMTAGGQAASPVAKLGLSGWLPVAAPSVGVGYINALGLHDEGGGQRLYAAGHIPLAYPSRAIVERLDASGWSAVLTEYFLADQGTCLRSVNEGDGNALYMGTTNGLSRLRGGTWSVGGVGLGVRVWSITPTFDDGSGPGAFAALGPSPYTAGGLGSVERIRLCPVCYPNCDGSTVAPVLNVADFTCFLNRFSAGDSYANCDASTAPPVLNVADFACFLNRFSAGCP